MLKILYLLKNLANMTLTSDQLKVLSFGYLTGNDLLQWCPAQLLIKQYEVDSNSLQSGSDQAISEIVASFTTRYNMTAELEKSGVVLPSAIALLTSGGVSAINILVPGNNFISNPTINLIGGGGSGANATASILNNAVNAITVSAAGINYTSAPSVIFVGGQSADTRSKLLVKILSLLTIRNVLGSMQNISEKMGNDFKWADSTVKDIRRAQMNLPLPTTGNTAENNTLSPIASTGQLVCDSFKTLG